MALTKVMIKTAADGTKHELWADDSQLPALSKNDQFEIISERKETAPNSDKPAKKERDEKQKDPNAPPAGAQNPPAGDDDKPQE